MAAPWLYFFLLGVFSAVLQLLCLQNNKMAGGLGPVMPVCFQSQTQCRKRLNGATCCGHL